ncbi:MAG TPA: DUF3540 domain-containing protein [Polyangiaceae bacterium]
MSRAVVRSIHTSVPHEPPVPLPAAAAALLGRALVASVSGGGVEVVLADGSRVRATFALALPYAAQVGDELLVIGQGGEHFVIGVIAGTGKTSLEVRGDLCVRAVGGALDLCADEGVSIRGASVALHAEKLEAVARSVVHTFSSLVQRVTEVLHVHARQSVSIVDEDSYSQARAASIQTEETVTINGKEIHLG